MSDNNSNSKEYTLTFSESVNGWPSFYSYNPDFTLGMNQYLYTFKMVIFIGIIPMKEEITIMV